MSLISLDLSGAFDVRNQDFVHASAGSCRDGGHELLVDVGSQK